MAPRPSRLRAGALLALLCPSAACSLVYSDYRSRFGSLPFVAENGNVIALGVASSGVYYAVGPTIFEVALDGSDRTTVWTGDGGAEAGLTVLAIATDGADHLAWTYGAPGGVPNAVYAASASSASSAQPFAGAGLGVGVHMVADGTSVAWTAANAEIAPSGNVILQTYDWATGTAPTPVNLVPTDPGMQRVVGEKSLALSPTVIYAYVNGAGLVAVGRATQQATCTEAAIPAHTSQLGLAASTTSLYLLSGDNGGNLSRYDLNGGCPSATSVGVALDTSMSVALVAADDTGVFWVRVDGTVWASGLETDAPRALGTTGAYLSQTSAMALDATYVYVATGTSIYRFAK